jgi:hypothetical protein
LVSAAADLRANAVRHAAAASGSSPGGGGGGTLTSQELLRRLRDTQALLIKFSEENGRLAADNQMLQAGRKALGVEHASVLDEIGELTASPHPAERLAQYLCKTAAET